MQKMIEVLVVDDSSFMRMALRKMINRADGLSVVDVASDGVEAVEKAVELGPDVITMDVQMPKLGGIEAVRRIMDRAPCPILMVSSATREGAQTTMEAMDAGAVDFIPKESEGDSLRIREVESKLVEKIRAVARSASSAVERLREKRQRGEFDGRKGEAGRKDRPSEEARKAGDIRVVAIGVSTGGPAALQELIPELPRSFPVPVVIAQHMPPQFTASLSERLDSTSALRVREARDGMHLQEGTVTLAKGDRHLLVRRRGGEFVAETQPEGNSSYCPSVDRLFRSAKEATSGHLLGVVMTGMGEDGLSGARAISEAGGLIYAQDEPTSVVYGMPRAVSEAGLADGTFAISQIADSLVQATRTPAR